MIAMKTTLSSILFVYNNNQFIYPSKTVSVYVLNTTSSWRNHIWSTPDGVKGKVNVVDEVWVRKIFVDEYSIPFKSTTKEQERYVLQDLIVCYL